MAIYKVRRLFSGRALDEKLFARAISAIDSLKFMMKRTKDPAELAKLQSKLTKMEQMTAQNAQRGAELAKAKKAVSAGQQTLAQQGQQLAELQAAPATMGGKIKNFFGVGKRANQEAQRNVIQEMGKTSEGIMNNQLSVDSLKSGFVNSNRIADQSVNQVAKADSRSFEAMTRRSRGKIKQQKSLEARQARSQKASQDFHGGVFESQAQQENLKHMREIKPGRTGEYTQVRGVKGQGKPGSTEYQGVLGEDFKAAQSRNAEKMAQKAPAEVKPAVEVKPETPVVTQTPAAPTTEVPAGGGSTTTPSTSGSTPQQQGGENSGFSGWLSGLGGAGVGAGILGGLAQKFGWGAKKGMSTGTKVALGAGGVGLAGAGYMAGQQRQAAFSVKRFSKLADEDFL